MLYQTALFAIVKNQDLSKNMKPVGLLSSLGIKTPLSKISLVVPRLFQRYSQVNARDKMNEIVSKALLAGDKFMPEMHLRQPGFRYSACGSLTKD